MNKSFALADQAEGLIGQGCLVTAEKKLREAEELVTEDCERILMAYQLGALHWGSSGDGEKAREHFLRTVKLWQTCPAAPSQNAALYATLYGNACENLMILSLSFKEYFEWADRLKLVAPQEQILHEHLPKIRTAYEASHPWSAVMMWMSGLYVNPDPTKDPGRYGSASSILQLMLKNRRTLRLSRHDWKMAAISYGAVAALAAGHCDKVMREKTGRTDPLEYMFIVEKAIPLVEEYVNANLEDPQAQKTLEGLRGGLAFATKTAQGEPPPRETDHVPKFKPSILIAPFLWALLAGWAIYYLHKPWNFVLGIPLLILGIITAVAAFQIISRKNRQEPDKTIGWRFNSELRRAIQKQGLSGLSFHCLGAQPALDGSIEIKFESLTPVPEEKREVVHLALRCVVGLTFPQVVSCMPNYQIGTDPSLTYTVRLGDGVPMPFYFVKTPVERVGPLQVTSEESEGRYWVYVKPVLIQLDLPGKGADVLAEIAPAFGHWKSLSVDLK